MKIATFQVLGLKRIKLIGFCFLLAACSLQLAACGYTTRSMIEDKFKTIYIEPFVNKVDIANEAYAANKYRIYRPILETDITQSVINKFLFDGNLRPVKDESADLLLKGELVEFRRDPLQYSNSDTVTEYRLNIVVNISIRDKTENKLLWEEKNFTGTTTYFTTGANAKTEDFAINDALADLARRIVERTVEQW
jgi:predicted small secreted protein